MNQLEYHLILIESHRQYLRDLFDPRALPVQGPSRRERLGNAIVRFGHWVANHCPEVATEPAGGAQPGLTQP